MGTVVFIFLVCLFFFERFFSIFLIDPGYSLRSKMLVTRRSFLFKKRQIKDGIFY